MADKTSPSVAQILSILKEHTERLNELKDAISKLQASLDKISERTQTDSALAQTQAEEIKELISQLSKATSGAKRAIKPSEDAPAETKTVAKNTNAKKEKKLTLAQYFAQQMAESEAFRSKYDNNEVRKHHAKTGKLETRSFRAIDTASELAKIKADLKADYDKYVRGEETAEEVKDEL